MKKSTRILAGLLIFLAFAGSASAADKTWANTGTDYNTTGNWTGGLPGTGDAALFSSAVTNQPVLSGAIQNQQIRFTTLTGGWTLSGASALTLTSTGTGATAGTGSAIVSSNTSGTNTISAPIILGQGIGETATFSQTGGLGTLAISGNISSTNTIAGLSLATVSGAIITLSGNNTYSGNTTISYSAANTLNINSATALSSGTLVNAGNATLTLNNTSGSAVTLTNNNNLNSFAGNSNQQITFTGANNLSFGSGTLTIGQTSRTLNITAGTLTFGSIDSTSTSTTLVKSGLNTLAITGAAGANFQGGTTLSSGILLIGNKSSLGTGLLSVTGTSTLAATADLSGPNAVANNVGFNANLTIGGSGNLTLSGNITLNNNRTLTSSNAGATDLSGNIYLSNVSGTGYTMTINGAQSMTISGAISNFNGAGTAGNLAFTNTAGTVSLTNVNSSYNGTTTASTTTGAVLAVAKLADGGSNSSIGSSSNAAANILLPDNSTLRYVGTGDSTDRLFTINGSNNLHDATIDASGSGAINFTNTGSLAYGTANQTRVLTLQGTNNGNNTFAPKIENNGTGATALTKGGNGTWVLTGNNSYTGATTISGGVLSVSTLADAGSNSNIGAAAIANANLVINGGTLRYTGNGSSTNRGITLGNGNGSTIDSSGSGAINFTGTASMSSTANETLTLAGTNAGNNTLALNLGSSASLVKAGAGTWVLSGTKSYLGTTTINAGTLVVDATGSWSGTSGIAVSGSTSKLRYDSTTALNKNVTVTSGGTFAYNSSADYSGTLTLTNGKLGGTEWDGAKLGGLTIGANQTITPGNSVGTAATTTQTWANNGSYVWEINKGNGTAGDGVGGGWDLLTLSGALTISATSGTPFAINITSLGLDNLPGSATGFDSSLSYNWLIADAGSAITPFSSDQFVLNTIGTFQNAFTGNFAVALGNTGSIGGDSSQLYLTYTAVPEPATWALLAFSLTTVVVLRRRRRD